MLSGFELYSRWVPLSHYEQNTPEYTYQRNETDVVFQKLPEEIQSKIVYFYGVITNIHSAVKMFAPRHLDTNDQISNIAHDA